MTSHITEILTRATVVLCSLMPYSVCVCVHVCVWVCVPSPQLGSDSLDISFRPPPSLMQRRSWASASSPNHSLIHMFSQEQCRGFPERILDTQTHEHTHVHSQGVPGPANQDSGKWLDSLPPSTYAERGNTLIPMQSLCL